MARRRAATMVAAVSLVGLAACSSRAGESAGVTSTTTAGTTASTTTSTVIERPPGPAAELTPLTGGKGIDLVSTGGPALAVAGWVEEEYRAAGTATSYRAVGELPEDGTFVLEPDATAEFATRIVVRRPGEAADFDGTVVVEWLNVSGGLDAAPDWTFAAEELVRGATPGWGCRLRRSAWRAGRWPCPPASRRRRRAPAG